MSFVRNRPQCRVTKGGRLGLYYKFRDDRRTRWVHKPFTCMANVRMSAVHQVSPPYFKVGFVYDEYGRTTPRMKEVLVLGCVFCEENWKKEYPIRHANKVLSVQKMEQK